MTRRALVATLSLALVAATAAGALYLVSNEEAPAAAANVDPAPNEPIDLASDGPAPVWERNDVTDTGGPVTRATEEPLRYTTSFSPIPPGRDSAGDWEPAVRVVHTSPFDYGPGEEETSAPPEDEEPVTAPSQDLTDTKWVEDAILDLLNGQLPSPDTGNLPSLDPNGDPTDVLGLIPSGDPIVEAEKLAGDLVGLLPSDGSLPVDPSDVPGAPGTDAADDVIDIVMTVAGDLASQLP